MPASVGAAAGDGDGAGQVEAEDKGVLKVLGTRSSPQEELIQVQIDYYRMQSQLAQKRMELLDADINRAHAQAGLAERQESIAAIELARLKQEEASGVGALLIEAKRLQALRNISLAGRDIARQANGGNSSQDHHTHSRGRRGPRGRGDNHASQKEGRPAPTTEEVEERPPVAGGGLPTPSRDRRA